MPLTYILVGLRLSLKLAVYPAKGKVSPMLKQLWTVPQRHLEEWIFGSGPVNSHYNNHTLPYCSTFFHALYAFKFKFVLEK
jgi:hypothetical protein